MNRRLLLALPLLALASVALWRLSRPAGGVLRVAVSEGRILLETTAGSLEVPAGSAAAGGRTTVPSLLAEAAAEEGWRAPLGAGMPARRYVSVASYAGSDTATGARISTLLDQAGIQSVSAGSKGITVNVFEQDADRAREILRKDIREGLNAGLIEAVSAPGNKGLPTEPEWKKALGEKMKQTIHLQFDGLPFRGAIGFLEDQGKANILIDRAARESAPVEDQPVSLASPEKGMTLGAALDALTNQTGLVWEPRDEAIAVTTRDRKGKSGPFVTPKEMPEILKALLEKKIHLKFDGLPFGDAKDSLVTMANLTLKTVGVPENVKDVPVHMASPEGGMALASALNWLCDETGLLWTVKEETVLIGKDAEALRAASEDKDKK